MKIVNDQAKADLLCRTFQETYVQPHPPLSNVAVLCPSDVNISDDVDLSEFAVYRCLPGLKPSRSLNPERLPALFFKRIAAGIARPLSMLFRLSLDSGRVPAAFRTAWISPVHKKGSRSDPLNKRPVSLTSIICKTMERLICDTLLVNAETQRLLSDRQFAYRRHRSTQQSLLSFLNFIALRVNEKSSVDVIYTDFKSAFETMPHDLLLSVLPAKGVGPRITRWISDFLRDRSFRVKVNDSLSTPGFATTGAPQGTVIGSLLFLFFVDQVL